MRIGNREFDERGKTYVMGILNVTPDSFSDGGKYQSVDAALFRAEEMLAEGADIIDIGAESTRPGHTPVDEGEETERLIPVVSAIKRRLDVPLSVDTRKARAAREALEAGADLINDVSGLMADPEMAGVIARFGVPCCLMHDGREAAGRAAEREAPGGEPHILHTVRKGLEESLALAGQAGIAGGKIILDPGIGFGKTREENLALIGSLKKLKDMFGLPFLLGASRKSVIGLTLNLPETEREEGTLVTTVYAFLQECMFVRVHDVRANKRALRMAEAIREAREYSGGWEWIK